MIIQLNKDKKANKDDYEPSDTPSLDKYGKPAWHPVTECDLPLSNVEAGKID